MGDSKDGKRSLIGWFTNVFLPYYKWRVIGVIAALVLVGVFIYDIATTPQPDISFLILSGAILPEEKADALGEAVGEAAGDLNGDEKATSVYQIINPNGDATEMARLEIFLSDWHYQLILADEESLPCLESRAGESYWADLTEYGLDTIPGKPYLADLSGSKVLSAAGLGDTIRYAALQTIPQDAPDEIIHARAAALQCIREGFLW